MGVKPTSPGYGSYIIEPSLAGLEWMKGKVPTPLGDMEIYMDTKKIIVNTVSKGGILKIRSKKTPKVDKGVKVSDTGNGIYEIALEESGKSYNIRYW